MINIFKYIIINLYFYQKIYLESGENYADKTASVCPGILEDIRVIGLTKNND